MKVISSLIAILALSSCVAKPWFVGSVNDHYKMHAYEAGVHRHNTIFHREKVVTYQPGVAAEVSH
jgi:hypothetical protein